MSAKILSFMNEKGGIGKTSFTFNISWELAKREYRVLLIDLNGQEANLSYFCGLDDLNSQFPARNDIDTICEVLRGKRTIPDVTIQIKENLYLVPANNDVEHINQSAGTKTFREALNKAREAYDFIFIDVGPSTNWNQYMTLACADYIVIPMQPNVASLQSNIGASQSIVEAQSEINPGLRVLGILFNEYTTRTNVSRFAMQQAELQAEKLGTTVFEHGIRRSVAMSENPQLHEGITDYAPNSDAAQDARLVTDELIERIQEAEQR